VRGGVTEPVDPLIPGFTGRWSPPPIQVGFGVHVHVAGLPACSKLARQTGQHAATPRINKGEGKSGLLGKHGEVWKVVSRGHLPDRRDKVASNTACAWMPQVKGTRSSLDSTAEPAPAKVLGQVWKHC
jgi:hypothetical protein